MIPKIMLRATSNHQTSPFHQLTSIKPKNHPATWMDGGSGCWTQHPWRHRTNGPYAGTVTPQVASVAPHCSNSLREVLMTVLWQAWPRAMGGKEWGKSLKLTASSPLKINGWNMKFLLEDLVFRSYIMLVSGSVGFSKEIWKLEWNRYSLEVCIDQFAIPQKENTVFQPPFFRGLC